MFKVTVRGLDGSETHYPLGADQGLIVGRDEAGDVVLPSKRVSRRHARIYTRGNQLHIEDLGSQNGVFVGGARIAGTAEIRPNLAIEIGEFKIQIKREDLYAPENMYAGTLAGFGATEGLTLNLPAEKGIVGRDASADIVIQSDSVSRQHAEIRNAGPPGYYVQDLGSSNGTFLNGARLPPKAERPLRPGDRVNFGDTGWTVVPQSALETPAAARSSRRKFGVFVLIIGSLTLGAVYFLRNIANIGPHSGEDGGMHAPGPSAWSVCQQAIVDRKWPDAQRACGEAYDDEPFIERRTAFRQAQFEMMQKEIFDDANRKAAVGADREAVERFFAIDPRSSYFPQARLLVQQLAKNLMKASDNACREAGRQRKWERALETCRAFLRYQCHNGVDKAALKILRDAETAQKGKSGTAWECPSELAIWFKTGVDVSGLGAKAYCGTRYEDKGICDGIIAYAHKDPEKAKREIGRAQKDPKTADQSRKLLETIILIVADYGLGTNSNQNFQEIERLFKVALSHDAEIMQPGVESDYAKDMKSRLADHYAEIGDDTKKKGEFNLAFKAYMSGLPYRPAVEQSLVDLETVARGALSQSKTCDDLTPILQYTRDSSDVYKETIKRIQDNGCKQ